ncbi:bifunctional adenosylcobinamide kinase/adenosylcobinamide-phosphate guanylyltransferase [Fusibacter tunisiensis]|uniref:Adenosylcobinamide kinase n=1 Tax=Fusibacter tunisiensis TaxID=1008308 RepID=A0ABS2MN78_9FIRM|nr:bifunctional adenosylcobinamide kinase/adenosylcobinamide-phosphate guanylyltransferase [Fusibacter tunisiensis]MBM7560846.1 hypothetical protein [Fusibacter tunisiensis]
MITFVFGGLYQGQEEYMETLYKPYPRLETVRSLKVGERGLIFPAEVLAKDLPLDKLGEILASNKGDLVIVGRDIGAGVVPIDPEERAYRDHVGRCYQLISSVSDRVVRVSMGISEVLK